MKTVAGTLRSSMKSPQTGKENLHNEGSNILHCAIIYANTFYGGTRENVDFNWIKQL